METKVPNLSVIVHVQNEEKRLPSFLEHLAGFANDIVIINDYSTDKTEAIAKQYGCRVFKLRTGDFSEKDNFATKKCRHEWVLLLDVDERLEDALKIEIKKTVESNPKENLFYVRRKEFFMYRRYATTWQPRLYRRDEIIWANPVHEVPMYKGNPGYIRKGAELHYPPQDMNTIIKKLIYYTDLEVGRMEKMGRILKSLLLIKMFFNPIYYFFVYLFYAGYIRAGIPGITFAFNGMYYKYATYAKYYEKHFVEKKHLPYQ